MRRGRAEHPRHGDTAVLNHAVTVDDTRIVGTSPAAGPGTDAIRCNAALTITATGNLTVRGDRAQQRAAELVYRRYHKFIPKLRGRDGAHTQPDGLRRRACDTRLWLLDGCSGHRGGYGSPRNPLEDWSGRPDSNRRRPAWEAGILPLNYGRSSSPILLLAPFLCTRAYRPTCRPSAPCRRRG